MRSAGAAIWRLTTSLGERWSRNRVDDLGPQPREALQVGATLRLEALDDVAVLVAAALARIELAWLQDLLVVDPRDEDSHLVAEIGVGLPLDGALGDRLHCGARVGD